MSKMDEMMVTQRGVSSELADVKVGFAKQMSEMVADQISPLADKMVDMEKMTADLQLQLSENKARIEVLAARGGSEAMSDGDAEASVKTKRRLLYSEAVSSPSSTGFGPLRAWLPCHQMGDIRHHHQIH